MMYCRQMYGIIERELVCDDKKISCGENITARWGSIHLFQEKYDTPGLVSTIDRRTQISCDGHKSFMKNDPHPVFVVRCLKWVGTMRKKRRINIRHIDTVSDIELRRHLNRQKSEGQKDNKVASSFVGKLLDTKPNTVSEIREMALLYNWFKSLASLDFEKSTIG